MKTSQVCAALGEAGFHIVELDPWSIAAKHERREVWVRARTSGGGVWDILVLQRACTAAITPSSPADLIEVLHEHFGERSTRRRERAR